MLQKNWLVRDGEKHVELCLDVGQSSENPAVFSVDMYFRANVTYMFLWRSWVVFFL